MINEASATQVVVTYCTCPNLKTARLIAETLVEEGRAACVNILPGVSSVYRWQTRIETDVEVLLMIKTTENQIAPMTNRITDLHPYEVPEVICHPITAGHETYLEWVRQCTANNT